MARVIDSVIKAQKSTESAGVDSASTTGPTKSAPTGDGMGFSMSSAVENGGMCHEHKYYSINFVIFVQKLGT